jgi:FkbM family methyltransferase
MTRVNHSVRQVVSVLARRLQWAARDRFGSRTVVREVQGVRMSMPWSHRLPDYAAIHHDYGQNLVQLAALLADDGDLTVLDVGANIGDSAVQLLHAADGRVLSIEADPFYLEYLHLNADGDPRITVVEALLTPDAAEEATSAVRSGGTTRFAEGGLGDAMPALTPEALRRDHPDFDRLRLVKSDTDGYDTTLVQAIATAWRDEPPVLFFEYDHRLTRLAGHEPLAVWAGLAGFGYSDVAVWDNNGVPLGRTDVDSVGDHAAILDLPLNQRGHQYWDVAVVHEDDAAGLQAVESLVQGSLAAGLA